MEVDNMINISKQKSKPVIAVLSSAKTRVTGDFEEYSLAELFQSTGIS